MDEVKLSEKFEGETVETINYKEENDENGQPKKLANKIFGAIIAFSIGIFAGMSCKSIGESLLYSALFLGESFICVCISGIVKALNFKNSIIAFSIYFGICAVVTPLASYGGSFLI